MSNCPELFVIAILLEALYNTFYMFFFVKLVYLFETIYIYNLFN